MMKHECYQTTDAVQVVHDDGDGACVTISRSMGSPLARSLMRFCCDALNGDVMSAEAEFETFMLPLIEARAARQEQS